MITLREKREGGRKTLQVVIPRRVLLSIRIMRPDNVEFKFGENESFQADSKALSKAILEGYKGRIERCFGR